MVARRDFLRTSALGLTALAVEHFSRNMAHAQSRPADCHIEVLLNEPLGTISSNIYGHFAEDLGGVIYDGIWVGENSKIPNIYGIRKALVDHLRAIHAPVVR